MREPARSEILANPSSYYFQAADPRLYCDYKCYGKGFGLFILSVTFLSISFIASTAALASLSSKVFNSFHTCTKLLLVSLALILGPGLFITLSVVFGKTPVIGSDSGSFRDWAVSISAALGFVLLACICECIFIVTVGACCKRADSSDEAGAGKDIELQETSAGSLEQTTV